MKDLDGRVAVVTGGASGIGLGIAKALARAGMRIALLDLEERAIAPAEASVRDVGGDVVGIPADVSSRYSLDAAAQRVLENYGRADVLCNNAGVVVLGNLADASAEDWRWVMGVNLMGAVNGVAAFLPHIRAQGSGHIVNTASIQGLSAAAGLGVYTTSKYAVVAYSETLRLELAPEQIGVSVLCPGVVNPRSSRRIAIGRRSSRAPATRHRARCSTRSSPRSRRASIPRASASWCCAGSARMPPTS